jgi:hypothetical protein
MPPKNQRLASGARGGRGGGGGGARGGGGGGGVGRGSRKTGKGRAKQGEATEDPNTDQGDQDQDQGAGAVPPVPPVQPDLRRSPTPPPEDPPREQRSRNPSGSSTHSTRSTTERRRQEEEAAAGPPKQPKKRRAVPVTSLEAFSTTEKQETFIEWWETEPCLYDKRSDGYMRKDNKEAVVKAKAEELNISVDQIMKFMKHLRDAFNRVNKEVDLKTRSGAGQLELNTFLSAHDIWVYHVMGWIRPHLIHHAGQSVGVSKIGI